MAFTKEMRDQIDRAYSGTGNVSNGLIWDPETQRYYSSNNPHGGDPLLNADLGLGNYFSYEKVGDGRGGYDDLVGTEKKVYDADGNYKYSETFQEKDPMWQTLATYLAILGTAGLAGPAVGAALGGNASAAAAAAGMEAGIGGGSMLGAAGGGTAAGVGGAALGDAAAGSEAMWMNGAEAWAPGATEAAGGASGGLNAVNGMDLMSDQFVANGGYGAGGFGGTNGGYFANLLNGTGSLGSRLLGGTGAADVAGTASTAANAAGTGSGLLNTLGGAKGVLGLGATLLGGVAGAQGNKAESSSVRDIPEWLKPDVTNVLGHQRGLLDKQMAPGYLQGYDDMRSVGQGLLNRPVMGNGFNRFFPGK